MKTIDSYISVDIETTGLNAKWDKIIEIGAVKVRDGVIIDSYSTYVSPCREIPEVTTKLTGICNQDVANARTIEEVIPEFLVFIENLPLVGHSIHFDYSFLKRAAVNAGIAFEREAVDTLKISRIALCSLESRKLEDLCNYYKISIHAHRALEDARATALLYERLKEEFSKSHNELFVPHKLEYKVKKDSLASEHQKERLLKLIELHHLENPYDISKMTKNEVSRYTDLILAEYGR